MSAESRDGRRSDSGLPISDPMQGGARTVGAVAIHRPAPPIPSAAFHGCPPPPGEEYAKRWWTDETLPWRVCMFCGVRQMKP